MIIPVTISRPSQFSTKLPPQLVTLGHDELFLIELQGTLDVEGTEKEDKDGQVIGTLNTTDMNKPTLTIGYHLLEGKVVNLAKPLGVLHKQVSAPVGGESTGPESQEEIGVGTKWDVIAIVKKKMVFSKRPMPIATGKPASKAPSSRRA
ncbi:Ctf8-domain-containing protein [Pisolithus orientalis]|uniref:Ctf8-domain-containing protein n=1 Tax=Pisolithus orientalis TaxID=936130 RepID=UPI0022253BB2|nr:Ctf8-domain-containing protein [Pisolithus orientalis]KAI6006614.1 Ctf8-domain-containing protein [Pisolithus orientalis]